MGYHKHMYTNTRVYYYMIILEDFATITTHNKAFTTARKENLARV